MTEVNYALPVGIHIFLKIKDPLQALYDYILSTDAMMKNEWGVSVSQVKNSDFLKNVKDLLEKCRNYSDMNKSELYAYTRGAQELLETMKTNTNSPTAFGGTPYQGHRTAMEPKIDACIKCLDVYNQYCGEIETATANKFECSFSRYLTTQGFTEEKAREICGNLGIVRQEHLVYLSIPEDIWNNKILDNNDKIKLQHITQTYLSDIDKKVRKTAQTSNLKSLFDTCTKDLQNPYPSNDYGEIHNAVDRFNVYRVMSTFQTQGLQILEKYTSMSTFKNNSKLGVQEIEIPNIDTLLEKFEEAVRVVQGNIIYLVNNEYVKKNDQQVAKAWEHIDGISKEIDNIKRIYLQSEYQPVSLIVNSKHTNISVLLMKLKNSC
jgi:hypothetical protein